MCVCCLFWVIFFSHIDCNLLRRWAVLQSENLCISYRPWLLGILLMCLSVSFLIIPRAPTITGTIVILRKYIFLISISRSLFLLILLCSFPKVLLLFLLWWLLLLILLLLATPSAGFHQIMIKWTKKLNDLFAPPRSLIFNYFMRSSEYFKMNRYLCTFSLPILHSSVHLILSLKVRKKFRLEWTWWISRLILQINANGKKKNEINKLKKIKICN